MAQRQGCIFFLDQNCLLYSLFGLFFFVLLCPNYSTQPVAHGEIRYCYPTFVLMPSLMAYALALGEGVIVLRVVIDRP